MQMAAPSHIEPPWRSFVCSPRLPSAPLKIRPQASARELLIDHTQQDASRGDLRNTRASTASRRPN